MRQILILMEPDAHNGNLPYFWMLTDGVCNWGHGWAASQLEAYLDAESYYNNDKKERSSK